MVTSRENDLLVQIGETSRAAEVSGYLRRTTDLIEGWIRAAEEDNSLPVSRFGSSRELRDAVQLPSLKRKGCSDGELMGYMGDVLTNSVHPWTGRFVDKLYTAPLTTGPAFEALLTAINANAHIISAAPMLCLAEESCVSALAQLCGWDADLADGLTMPGGSSSNTFAIQTAMTTLLPTFKQQGILGVVGQISQSSERSPMACKPLIFTGVEAHYSLEKAAISCGLGLDSVIKVPCNVEGDMNVDALEAMLQEAYDNAEGVKEKVVGLPFFINATAGSTVTGSFDRLDRMVAVCEKYRALGHKLWLHVDGSWGGPVLFSQKHRSHMQGIERCDSFTINPHKLLNIPHQCSFAMFRDGDCLSNNALDAPYLFHGTEERDSDHADARDQALLRKIRRRDSPAILNFGCGRRGDALKFYLAWLHNGASHFEGQVDAGCQLAQEVVSRLKTESSLKSRLEVSQNKDLFLQVCLRPALRHITNATTADKSRATQYVYDVLRQRKRFAVDFAPLGRGQGDFIRLVTHPSTSLDTLLDLVEEIATIGEQFDRR